MLTAREVLHFKAFGFLPLRGILTKEEVERLLAEHIACIGESRSAASSQSPSWRWAHMMRPSSPTFASLLDDPRFLVAAEQVVGKQVLGGRIDASRRDGDMGWHIDVTSPVSHNMGLTFIIYLDRLTEENGAIRFLPGSHHPEYSQYVGNYLAQAKERHLTPINDLLRLPSTATESSPGDVIMLSMHVWHASFGGKDRKLGSLVYWPQPEEPEAEEVLRTEHLYIREGLTRYFQHPVYEPLCDPHWFKEGGGRREKWGETLTSLGWLGGK